MGYTDVSFQKNRDDLKSQVRWVFILNGGAVAWKNSKQKTMADSTFKSKYILTCESSKEATWILNFIGNLGVVQNNNDPLIGDIL